MKYAFEKYERPGDGSPWIRTDTFVRLEQVDAVKPGTRLHVFDMTKPKGESFVGLITDDESLRRWTVRLQQEGVLRQFSEVSVAPFKRPEGGPGFFVEDDEQLWGPEWFVQPCLMYPKGVTWADMPPPETVEIVPGATATPGAYHDEKYGFVPRADAINPAHYRDVVPGFQYMEAMQHLLAGKDGVEAHLLGQVYKYLMRSGRKPGSATLEDYRKAKWYLDFLVASKAAGRPIGVEEITKG